MVLEAEIFNQQGNILELKFTVTHLQDKKFQTLFSDMFMCGATAFQIQVQSARCQSKHATYLDGNIIIFTRYKKLLKDDNLAYTCKLTSADFKNKDFTFCNDDIWHKVYHHSIINFGNDHVFSYKFQVVVEIDLTVTNNPFSSLYDDTESTDVTIDATDGSVQMHKVILIAASPVLKAMFLNNWKEASEAKIKMNFNQAGLEAFKEYIYLNKLPETNTELEELLLHGSFYIMPDLVQKCTVKLINKIDINNFSSLLDFATKNQLKTLVLTIITMVKLGLISIDELAADSLTETSKYLKNVEIQK